VKLASACGLVHCSESALFWYHVPCDGWLAELTDGGWVLTFTWNQRSMVSTTISRLNRAEAGRSCQAIATRRPSRRHCASVEERRIFAPCNT
jgi:hypothetical protein